jgi:murein DD-endopeptidase MepM/ murein hydrolase activator NlpD
VGLCLFTSLLFAKHLELRASIATPAESIVAAQATTETAAVTAGEDAVIHNPVLPQTLVSAQSTVTPGPSPTATGGEIPILAASLAPTPEPTPAAVYIVYKVLPGDTIGSIAAQYGISSSSIIWNNLDLEDPDTLQLGQSLRVPMTDGIIYDVRLGDTLTDIATKFSASVDDIVGFEGNHLSNADGIIENQVLFVPNGQPPVATPAPTPDSIDEPDEDQSDEGGYTPAPSHGGGAVSSAGFMWPVTGGISSYFGPSHPLGIDIDQYGQAGAPIYAAASGVVTFAGGEACCSYGYYVVVNHQNGFETLYAHLASFAVSQGQWVNQGDVLGYVGLTGRTTGYHLHFEVHLNGAVVDPLAYLP